ncbi:MAG: hypothetical protein LAT51_13445 [Flavobacteriaceae bacterium]|nr:hypothetical protein [Flavobacteriaceae bacterium]
MAKIGNIDVAYTVFISSKGLIRGATKSIIKLDIYEKECPVGIQFFGSAKIFLPANQV